MRRTHATIQNAAAFHHRDNAILISRFIRGIDDIACAISSLSTLSPSARIAIIAVMTALSVSTNADGDGIATPAHPRIISGMLLDYYR